MSLVTDQPAGRVVSLLVLTGALNALAAVGVFILVLAGGSCSDNGHIPVVAWVGAALLYLAGGTLGLQRAVRGIWAVPASVLLAGFWLVAIATVLTGSTGASSRTHREPRDRRRLVAALVGEANLDRPALAPVRAEERVVARLEHDRDVPPGEAPQTTRSPRFASPAADVRQPAEHRPGVAGAVVAAAVRIGRPREEVADSSRSRSSRSGAGARGRAGSAGSRRSGCGARSRCPTVPQ